MSKVIIFDDEAKNKLLSGVNKLAKTVSVTMGPRGKNVIIGKPVGAPVITKDGVSVAREVILDDPIEDLASQLVKEAAGRTATIAGDGTTTATVLTDELMTLSSSLLDSGFNPLNFRDGLEWSKDRVLEILDRNSIKDPSDEDIINISTISTNNDRELGNAIGEAYIWAGKDGTVGAEAFHGVKTSVKKVDGISLKSGYVSRNFLNKKGDTEVMLERCKILIVDRKVTHVNDFINLLNEVHKNNNSLLVISRGLEKEALSTLVENNKRGILNVCAINFPKEFTNDEWINDLSILTSGLIASEKLGNPLSSIGYKDLGTAERVVVGRFLTQIFNSDIDQDRREQKIEMYLRDCDQPIGDSDRLALKDRIAFLSCRAAIVTVGYNTELELREKGDRVEDAMHATYAAVTDGILPGGGTALLRASNEFAMSNIPDKYLPAAQVLIRACMRPFNQILRNGSIESETILKEILDNENFFYGYNVVSERVENLVESGVVDPLKVTKTALSNAVSVALLLTNTAAVMAERKEDPSDWQPPPGWRPPTGTLNHKY